MEMSRSEIKEKLAEILNMALPTANFDASTLGEDASITADVGLSSVGVLYVVIGIEELFNIRFEGVEFSDFRTIGDVLDYIEKKISQ